MFTVAHWTCRQRGPQTKLAALAVVAVPACAWCLCAGDLACVPPSHCGADCDMVLCVAPVPQSTFASPANASSVGPTFTGLKSSHTTLLLFDMHACRVLPSTSGWLGWHSVPDSLSACQLHRGRGLSPFSALGPSGSGAPSWRSHAMLPAGKDAMTLAPCVPAIRFTWVSVMLPISHACNCVAIFDPLCRRLRHCVWPLGFHCVAWARSSSVWVMFPR